MPGASPAIKLLTIVILLIIGAAMACGGCATEKVDVPAAGASYDSAPAKPLPFRGRLLEGDSDELPPSVAMSLTNKSPIGFSYREELTHGERHTPLFLSAIDPATYLGAPLGEYTVTAFASLSITDGDKVIGYYTTRARVAESYNIKSEPTHIELEHQARAAVRAKIDAQLAADASRLKDSSAAPLTAGAPSNQ